MPPENFKTKAMKINENHQATGNMPESDVEMTQYQETAGSPADATKAPTAKETAEKSDSSKSSDENTGRTKGSEETKAGVEGKSSTIGRTGSAPKKKDGSDKVTSGISSAAGAAAGVVIGAVANERIAAAAAARQERKNEEIEGEETDGSVENDGETEGVAGSASATASHSSIVDDSIQFATSPSDDMSFSEAFAAARAEVGAGGVFEWRGGLYGTYNASEWNNMSQAEKDEYHSHFSWSNSSSNDSTMVQDEPQVVDDDDEGEVRVLSVDTVSTDAGDIDIATVDVDGEEVYFVDLDRDGLADLGAVDLNHDGELGEGEVADLQGENLPMPSMHDAGPDTYLAMNDGPDYTNDANVDSYLA